MSRFSSQTLIRSAASSLAFLSAAARPSAVRRLSTLPESSLHVESDSDLEAKAVAVEKIEDIIHSFIVRRSKPDWIPFLPGASYWVPPRRTLYGVAGMVENLANALTEEEYLSLSTPQGWPSSAYYIHNDTLLSHLELSLELSGSENEISPIGTSLYEEEEG